MTKDATYSTNEERIKSKTGWYNSLLASRKFFVNLPRYIQNIPSYPRDFYRECKWFIQRGRRGWSDRDSWSIADYLCCIMPEMLDHMVEYSHSTGGTRNPETGEYEWDKDRWEKVLKDISQGFKAGRTILDLEHIYPHDKSDWKFKQERAELEAGLDLLKEHLLGLWD